MAGNQTSRAGEILRKLDLPTDMIATSDDWNAVMPDASFFRAVIDSAPCEAGLRTFSPTRALTQQTESLGF